MAAAITVNVFFMAIPLMGSKVQVSEDSDVRSQGLRVI